jgi:hypothetical protein
MIPFPSSGDIPVTLKHHILSCILRLEWATDVWITSTSGVTNWLCQAFKMCYLDPLDMASMAILVDGPSGLGFYFSCLLCPLTARNFVDRGGRTLDWTKRSGLVTSGKLNSNIVDTSVYAIIVVSRPV